MTPHSPPDPLRIDLVIDYSQSVRRALGGGESVSRMAAEALQTMVELDPATARRGTVTWPGGPQRGEVLVRLLPFRVADDTADSRSDYDPYEEVLVRLAGGAAPSTADDTPLLRTLGSLLPDVEAEAHRTSTDSPADVLLVLTDGFEWERDDRFAEKMAALGNALRSRYPVVHSYGVSSCSNPAFSPALNEVHDPLPWIRASDHRCEDGVMRRGAPRREFTSHGGLSPAERSFLDNRVRGIVQARDHDAAPPPPPRSVPNPGIDLRPLGYDGFEGVVAVGAGDGWHCSGVLIAERVVLTAAHCLPAERVNVEVDVEGTARPVSVARAEAHPSPDVDAALLVLDEQVRIEAEPMRAEADGHAPMGQLRAVGYGATDMRGTRGFGRRHTVDIPATGWGCDPTRAATLGCHPDWEMALRSPVGDTCAGDSGGGVFEAWFDPGAPQASTASTPCGWRLVGITSRPVANARVACGSGGIYTRVDRIRPWIDEVLSQIEVM